MNQKLFKKSATFKIDIPRTGCKINKSLSTVMMQEALAETANSRNLLSLGSEHSGIAITASINAAFARNSFMAESFLSSGTYYSNFNQTKVSANSSNVTTEYITMQESKALLYARLFFDSARIYALKRVLASQIKSLVIIIQMIIEDFFSKSVSFRFSAKVIQKFFMAAGRSIVDHFFEAMETDSLKRFFVLGLNFPNIAAVGWSP